MRLSKKKFFALILILFLSLGTLVSCDFLDSVDKSTTIDEEKTSDETKTSGDPSEEKNETYLVKVHIEFSANIFMDIYDMNFYLDGDFIDTIPHGEDKDYTFDLKYGTHTFKVMNNPENSFKRECAIDVKDNISTTLYLKGHDGYMDFYKKSETTIDVHTITYNLNGGVNDKNNPSKFMSSESVKLYPATKDNYTFEGWSYNGSIILEIPKGTNNDITLEAVFAEKEYTITYSLDGGVNDSENPTKFKLSSSSFELKEAKRYKSTFVGWYLDSNFNGEKVTNITDLNSNLTTITDVTLYAKFESDYNFDLAYSTTNAAGETLYLMFDTSKKIVKQFDTSSNTVNTGMYSGNLNSSEYLYSLLINFTFSGSSGYGYLFRTTSSLNSSCVFVISGNRITLKQCSISNAIKTISSMTVIETNEDYATLPTKTPEAGYMGSLTVSGETYNYFMYVDIKNNSWRLIATDNSFTNITPLGSGTLVNFVENDSYISFYTMETFGTVKIYKNNLQKLDDESTIVYTRGQ